MKTDLTKTIEHCLKQYHPTTVSGIKINKFRGQHTAFEVPVECGTTSSGLVDCVRISEYFGDLERQHVCICHTWKKEGIRRMAIRCPKGALDSEQAPQLCDEYRCNINAVKTIGSPKILITCFEIKITKADFKSKNGHNFVGNLNYYVIPKDIYEDVKSLVPEGVGIIVYMKTENFNGLRKKTDAVFRNMTDEAQKWIILSVLKRIRDDFWKEHSNNSPLWG